MQALRLCFLVDGGNVSHQSILGLCYERAEATLDFVSFQATSFPVAFECPFLTALEWAVGTGDELSLRFYQSFDSTCTVLFIAQDFSRVCESAV